MRLRTRAPLLTYLLTCSSSLTAVVLTLALVASAVAALAPFLADPRSKLAPALLTEGHSFLKAFAPASLALIKLGGSLLKKKWWTVFAVAPGGV